MTFDQPDLLTVPESLSPFAAWKRAHKVWTLHNPDDTESPWMASGPFIGYGKTEQEACADMARLSNLPHWIHL